MEWKEEAPTWIVTEDWQSYGSQSHAFVLCKKWSRQKTRRGNILWNL